MRARHAGQTIGAHVARGAVGMFVLKVAYSALAFGLGIVLARALGADRYGQYAYAIAWGLFAAAPATLGLDQFVVRRVAGDRAQSNWRDLRALLRTANIAGLAGSAVSVVLAAVAVGVAWLLGDRDSVVTILIGLLMVPVLVLMRIRQAALSGLGLVVRGQWPEMFLRPVAIMAGVLMWRLMSGPLSAEGAMAITIASSVLMLLLGAYLLRRNMPRDAGGTGGHLSLPWRKTLMPLAGLATVQLIQGQADVLLLGLLGPAADVGIYGVAARGAVLVVFFLNAANPALGPEVAALHAARNSAGIERVVRQVTRATTLLALPVAIALVAFGRFFLNLYGAAFVAGILPLAVLTCAQFINVMCGPVGTVLIMTGHEQRVARVVSLSSTVNVVVSASLIPLLGPLGAAIGSATSIVVWNVLLVRQVRLHLGINPTIFGGPRFA